MPVNIIIEKSKGGFYQPEETQNGVVPDGGNRVVHRGPVALHNGRIGRQETVVEGNGYVRNDFKDIRGGVTTLKREPVDEKCPIFTVRDNGLFGLGTRKGVTVHAHKEKLI